MATSGPSIGTPPALQAPEGSGPSLGDSALIAQLLLFAVVAVTAPVVEEVRVPRLPVPGARARPQRLSPLSERVARSRADAQRASEPAISAASSATRVGVSPTRTPRASSASCFAFAVPELPETIAPAWPIVLPGGAVKPAM